MKVMNEEQTVMSKWGFVNDREVYLFCLKNKNGAFVQLTNYGASIVAINVVDKNSEISDMVLGFNSLDDYLKDECYIGSTIGRYANRIANAKFKLGNEIHFLDRNDGENTNHGGFKGFNKEVFNFDVKDESTISFNFFSEEASSGGYPGNVNFVATYKWTDQNELIIDYRATTDKRTILNFTNHSYFNLSKRQNDIREHLVYVDAKEMILNSKDFIPEKSIQIRDQKEALKPFNSILKEHSLSGLNNYFVFQTKKTNQPQVILKDKLSGCVLEVFTSYPGVLVYTGDYLKSEGIGHKGLHYKPFDGVCIECQYSPDGPNQSYIANPQFDSNNPYHEQIIYKFKNE